MVLTQLERFLFDVIIDALGRWLDRVREAVMRPWFTYQALPDPSGVRDIPWEPEVDMIQDAAERAYEYGWNEATEDLDVEVPYTSTDSFVQAQIARTRNLLVRVPDEVADLIFARISEGISNGDSIKAIAKRVDDTLLFSGSHNWPNRALVIAQTETNRAANAGALGAGLMAQQLEGTPMVKQWLTSDDARVRADHREMDGARVPIADQFQVGQSSLAYPGDPLGAPSDVINCRCSILIRQA